VKKIKPDMNSSLALASRVLDMVNELGVAVPPETATVYAYSNMREQGYCIRVYQNSVNPTLTTILRPTFVTFAQYRTSDDLVVYVGKKFDISNNYPTDSAVNSARFFPTDRLADAAAYIVKAVEDAAKA
jgi:hypothetical protein